MSKYKVLKNIQKHITLTKNEKEYVLTLFGHQKIEKKTFILKQGLLCQKLFFVEGGSLRAYFLDEEGRESTIMFAVEDWWITDMDSFVNKKPTLLFIEALESCDIMSIKHSDLEELFIKMPKFERFFRILFQNAYIREQSRALQNISLTTKERYHNFISNYPAIVEKVSQKQIASYLGVTPEFLSSIK